MLVQIRIKAIINNISRSIEIKQNNGKGRSWSLSLCLYEPQLNDRKGAVTDDSLSEQIDRLEHDTINLWDFQIWKENSNN